MAFVTFDQLRIFLAVAEREHVTRAAEALNLTQSTVSGAIAALKTGTMSSFSTASGAGSS